MNRPYSKQEIAVIKKNKNLSCREIANILGRTEQGVSAKRRGMSLSRNHRDAAIKQNKPIKLKHKDGRLVERKSAVEFAEEFSVSKFHIRMVVNNGEIYDKVLFFKGWYDPTPLKKPIKVLDENDHEHLIKNLGDFCVKYSLKPNSLKKFVQKKVFYYAGLRHPEFDKIPRPKKKIYKLRFKKRNIVLESGNISKFESENGVYIKKLLSGRTLTSRSDIKLITIEEVERPIAKNNKLFSNIIKNNE